MISLTTQILSFSSTTPPYFSVPCILALLIDVHVWQDGRFPRRASFKGLGVCQHAGQPCHRPIATTNLPHVRAVKAAPKIDLVRRITDEACHRPLAEMWMPCAYCRSFSQRRQIPLTCFGGFLQFLGCWSLTNVRTQSSLEARVHVI